MSLSNVTVQQTYACNGVTTTFAIPFSLVEASQIQVYLIDTTTNNKILLAINTHYTLSPNSNNPVNVVTLQAYPSTSQIQIIRNTPLTQIIDYINNSSFLAEDHEKGMDRIVMMIQELKQSITDMSGVSPNPYPDFNYANISTGPVTPAHYSRYLVDTTTGPISFFLPPPTLPFVFSIKDIGGKFNTNPVYLNRNGAEKIENIYSTRPLMGDFGQWLVVCDGSDWWLF